MSERPLSRHALRGLEHERESCDTHLRIRRLARKLADIDIHLDLEL